MKIKESFSGILKVIDKVDRDSVAINRFLHNMQQVVLDQRDKFDIEKKERNKVLQNMKAIEEEVQEATLQHVKSKKEIELLNQTIVGLEESNRDLKLYVIKDERIMKLHENFTKFT